MYSVRELICFCCFSFVATLAMHTPVSVAICRRSFMDFDGIWVLLQNGIDCLLSFMLRHVVLVRMREVMRHLIPNDFLANVRPQPGLALLP